MIILSNGDLHHIGQQFTPDIETIAHALAHINRFTGHVGVYSVAQHCVLLSYQAPAHLALDALLHDAPEAYIGDVSAPLKRHLPDYRNLEQFYHDAIDQHFRVDTRNELVKDGDLRMLVTEAKAFGLPLSHFPAVEPFDFLGFIPWQPELAKRRFLERFNLLRRD